MPRIGVDLQNVIHGRRDDRHTVIVLKVVAAEMVLANVVIDLRQILVCVLHQRCPAER
jgi:hypothetical protein